MNTTQAALGNGSRVSTLALSNNKRTSSLTKQNCTISLHKRGSSALSLSHNAAQQLHFCCGAVGENFKNYSMQCSKNNPLGETF